MASDHAPSGGSSRLDLASYALFADLREEQRCLLLDQHRVLRFMAGMPLLHEQDDGQGLFLFRRGYRQGSEHRC